MYEQADLQGKATRGLFVLQDEVKYEKVMSK